MGQLSDEAKRTLCACGCHDDDIAQVAALCECGCTSEAILRLRCYRAELMNDLHERQRRIDRLDQVVRTLRLSVGEK